MRKMNAHIFMKQLEENLQTPDNGTDGGAILKQYFAHLCLTFFFIVIEIVHQV